MPDRKSEAPAALEIDPGKLADAVCSACMFELRRTNARLIAAAGGAAPIATCCGSRTCSTAPKLCYALDDLAPVRRRNPQPRNLALLPRLEIWP